MGDADIYIICPNPFPGTMGYIVSSVCLFPPQHAVLFRCVLPQQGWLYWQSLYLENFGYTWPCANWCVCVITSLWSLPHQRREDWSTESLTNSSACGSYSSPQLSSQLCLVAGVCMYVYVCWVVCVVYVCVWCMGVCWYLGVCWSLCVWCVFWCVSVCIFGYICVCVLMCLVCGCILVCLCVHMYWGMLVFVWCVFGMWASYWYVCVYMCVCVGVYMCWCVYVGVPEYCVCVCVLICVCLFVSVCMESMNYCM